ncbi:RHS repeat protein [Burkholderia sp. R-69980]|nr:RHS repeat protein [Burkholderia sp. R-69980]
MLLLVAFGARADYTSDCTSRYAKSGATQGSKWCALDAASNSPGGPGGYACLNDIDLIKKWCAGETDPQPEDSCPVADPIYPANGMVTLSENDFRSGDGIPLTFIRSYLSSPFLNSATAMGPGWINNWQRQLNVAGASGSSPKVIAYRANGQPLTFLLTGGQWRTSSFSGFAISQNGSGWTLTDLTTDTVESYSAQGAMLSETTHTGFTRTLTYDGAGRLTAINQRAADAVPKYELLTIKLDYDTQGRINRMTNPSGGLTQYGYDANNNLVSVTWPDGYVRRYVYDDSRFKNLLTGVVDESGSRIATWTYDERGRATAASHPDTTQNVQFSYGNNLTTMSWSNESGTINYASIAGMLRLTGGSTADGNESRNLDANGNLLQKTAPAGTAAYSYDPVGRPVRAAVSSASGTVITTVRYADATSLHPALVATPGKMRAFVYDASGNVTGYSEFDTSDITGASGFAATGTGNKLTVGARYDANNRLAQATVYVNGVKTEDWYYFSDSTGNINTAQDVVSGWLFGTQNRDAANRATSLTGNYREARLTYDKRGRVSQFSYDEQARPSTGGLHRFLTVNYAYTPDGRVASRTGTVARNGGSAEPITSDDIDQWISNYESGADPVGPPANLSGSLKALKASGLTAIPPVCAECYVFTKAKLAWKLFYRGLTVTPAGQPVRGDVPELQIAAQEQVPFPILMPDQNGQSKRAVLYAQLFQANSDSDPGFVKCALSGRCAKVYQKCIEYCADTTLPTPGGTGIPFFRCKNKCIADNGC